MVPTLLVCDLLFQHIQRFSMVFCTLNAWPLLPVSPALLKGMYTHSHDISFWHIQHLFTVLAPMLEPNHSRIFCAHSWPRYLLCTNNHFWYLLCITVTSLLVTILIFSKVLSAFTLKVIVLVVYQSSPEHTGIFTPNNYHWWTYCFPAPTAYLTWKNQLFQFFFHTICWLVYLSCSKLLLSLSTNLVYCQDLLHMKTYNMTTAHVNWLNLPIFWTWNLLVAMDCSG